VSGPGREPLRPPQGRSPWVSVPSPGRANRGTSCSPWSCTAWSTRLLKPLKAVPEYAVRPATITEAAALAGRLYLLLLVTM